MIFYPYLNNNRMAGLAELLFHWSRGGGYNNVLDP